MVERLQEQEENIQDLRQMMEFQVNIQTSLVREIECLKDQVDLLREQWHNHSDSSGCRFEDEDGGERIGNLASLASLSSLVQQPPSLLEHSYTVSQPSLTLLQSNTDIARQEDKAREGREISSSTTKLKPLVKVVKKKLSRELPGAVALVSSSGQEREREHIYVNNYDYADFYQTQDKSRPQVKIAQTRDGVYSAESDSGLDVTPEGTPYTSRPESELLISEDKQEDDIKASPRQLEIMMKESSSTGKTDR